MKNRPNYGIDAPKVIFNFIMLLLLALLTLILSDLFILKKMSIIKIAINLILILSALIFLKTVIQMFLNSLIFKIKNRDAVLNKLKISGNEKVLDVGCGLGLYLTGIAKRLSTGHITGIDIWQAEDLSKNNESNTLKNIKIEDVEGKTDLITADMREMPFKDNSFDITVASFAVHNIYKEEERKIALLEIMRVTKNNGKICIIDFRHIDEYKKVFEERGVKDIKIEKAGMVYPKANVLYAINFKY